MANPDRGYTARNRSAHNGGPSGVQRSYPSQLKEHESLFSTYEHLQGLPRGDSALTLLRKVASMVKPIMRKRGWKVQVLAEFLPPEANLLGLNINRGYKICIRLRYHNHSDLFLPIEQIVDTMLHELSHNVWGEHDSRFHKLWDELRDEHETLLMKGFTGEGFLGRGQKLGGQRNVPPPGEMRQLARQSAELRRTQADLTAGSGRRLGGSALHHGQDVREIIAGQALLRNTVNRGCGSGRTDAVAIADMAGQQTFKTQAEEDDANNRAIAEALFDLMEAEETAKLNGTFKEAPVNGGLAWSPEHGLYDPNRPPSTGQQNIPSEEDQMRWALAESERHASSGQADCGGLPPESLVSPITPMTPEKDRKQVPSLASRLRRPSSARSPVSPVPATTSTTTNTTKRKLSTATQVIDLSEPFNPDEWACEVCTCVNPVQFLACDACGVERNAAKEAPRQRSTIATVMEEPPRQTGLGWNCQQCGAFMEHKWWTCSACGMMKSSS